MAEQKEKTKISETAAAKERKQSNVAMVTNRRQNFKSTKKTTKPNSKKNTFISQSVESQIKIKDYKIGKSDHVVNLKNPFSQKFDQTSTTKNSVVKQLLPNPPKPLRSLPKKTKKIEVNLISNSSDLRTSQSFFKSSFDQNLKSEIKTTPSTIDKIEEEIEDIFAPPREYRILSLNIPKDWYKRVTVFIIFSLLLILPLQALTYYQGLQGTKDRILLATNEAIENLKLGEQAVVNLDLADAGHQFDQAESNFNLAQNEINALNSLTTEIIKILPAQRASMATGLNLLKAGQIVSAAGQSLINDAKKLLTSKSLPEYYQALAAFNGTLQQVIINFRQAKEYLEKVNPADLPPQHQQDFEKVLANLPKIENSILNLYQLNKAGLRLLGQEQWQRYMLVFLNNNELRATGGFMGSFGLIDIDRGEIKDLEIPGGGALLAVQSDYRLPEPALIEGEESLDEARGLAGELSARPAQDDEGRLAVVAAGRGDDDRVHARRARRLFDRVEHRDRAEAGVGDQLRGALLAPADEGRDPRRGDGAKGLNVEPRDHPAADDGETELVGHGVSRWWCGRL